MHLIQLLMQLYFKNVIILVTNERRLLHVYDSCYVSLKHTASNKVLLLFVVRVFLKYNR